MKRPHLLRRVAGLLGAVLIVVTWVFFAPPALGGSASYAVLYGSSMEPKLDRGDLAIVRPAEAYQVGDVVAYRSRDLGRTVLHRIVGRDGRRYVLKGDNNDFLDPERPSQRDLVGKLWLDVPSAGDVFDWLRSPAHSAFLLGGLALLGSGLGSGSRRRRGFLAPNERQPGPRGDGALALAARGAPATPILVTAAILAVVFGAVVFSRPDTRIVPDPGLYSQEGRFSYSADAPAGPVYATGSLSTGDPVFLKLVDQVSFGFDYSLASRAPARVSGSGELVAELSDGAGWKRSFTLRAKTTFSGPGFTTSGTLDLGLLHGMIDRFEAEAGVDNDSYLVSIVPRIEARGAVAGQKIDETFAPSLAFRLDQFRLQLATPSPGQEGEANSFVRSQAGSGRRSEPARLALGRFSVAVSTARALAILVALGSLAGLLLIGFARSRALAGDEPTRIEARYGAWLVPVAERGREESEPVRVATMEGLVQLAERYERVILHDERGGVHAYSVEEGGAVYRYETQSGPAEPRSGQAHGWLSWLATPWRLLLKELMR